MIQVVGACERSRPGRAGSGQMWAVSPQQRERGMERTGGTWNGYGCMGVEKEIGAVAGTDCAQWWMQFRIVLFCSVLGGSRRYKLKREERAGGKQE